MAEQETPVPNFVEVRCSKLGTQDIQISCAGAAVRGNTQLSIQATGSDPARVHLALLPGHIDVWARVDSGDLKDKLVHFVVTPVQVPAGTPEEPGKVQLSYLQQLTDEDGALIPGIFGVTIMAVGPNQELRAQLLTLADARTAAEQYARALQARAEAENPDLGLNVHPADPDATTSTAES